jgi:hypothetical protein
LFARKGQKGKLLQSLKISKELIWRQLFRLDKRVFKSQKFTFNYQIQTDGIGVSLSFIRNDLVGKKYGTRLPKIEKKPYNYIEDYPDADLKSFSKRNIIGVDPGKKFLLYMVDDNRNTLKYSAPQRRAESMGKRSTRILLNEKNKNKITEKETQLSEENCKTSNYKKFKNYIKDKTKLNISVRDFYIKDLWRKMKWRRFVYSRKSEDTFLNKISDTFGDECILAYGDWSRSTQMKHFMPTKNVGIC